MGKYFAEAFEKYAPKDKITTSSLALKTGIDRTSLHKIRSGRLMPTWDKLKALCQALMLTSDEAQDLKNSIVIDDIGYDTWLSLV